MGQLMQRLIKLVCLPQATLAAELTLSNDTVRSWSAGRTDPSPENRTALAAFMRKHAAELVKLAEELEG